MASKERGDAVAGRPVARGPDGRTARRNRNQDAVVEALLHLLTNGNLEPSTEQIAEQAGLSPRSLFRYFADTDELRREAVSRQKERIAPFFALDVSPHDPFSDRVAALAIQRSALFDAMGTIAVWARMKEPLQPEIAARLSEVRGLLRSQVEATVAAETATLDPALAESLLQAADVLASFEAYHYLSTQHQMTPEQWRRSLVASFSMLFGCP